MLFLIICETLRLSRKGYRLKNVNLFVDGFGGNRNIAILLKLLLFCCFDFEPKIYAGCIDSVYHLFYFSLVLQEESQISKKRLDICNFLKEALSHSTFSLY